MRKYIIGGPVTLNGSVSVSGGKNAAVAIIPATVLVKGKCIIENVPDISDVKLLMTILRRLGAKVEYLSRTTVQIDCTEVSTYVADFEEVRRMRASYYFIGALLGRFGKAQVGLPGGCDFGVRPIDQHIKGFKALGAEVDIEHGVVVASAKELTGASVYPDIVSVGTTINIMLAAVRAKGKTVIENAAKEPHIVDVANFLNAMGADIKGAGTDVIRIEGTDELTGGRYEIIPDQIEAGTYMVAAAAAGGRVEIHNIIPKHMESISAKLSETGAKIEIFDDYVIVSREPGTSLNKVNVKTLPYPGFPTDMQPQMSTLLTLAKGTSIVTEGIYDHRFKYVDELRRMGAHMEVDGKVCVIEGVDKLMGAAVRACDLRAGVSLIVAAICAEGVTEISGVELIERGYEDIIQKFHDLGAEIKVIDDGPDTAAENEKKIG